MPPKDLKGYRAQLFHKLILTPMTFKHMKDLGIKMMKRAKIPPDKIWGFLEDWKVVTQSFHISSLDNICKLSHRNGPKHTVFAQGRYANYYLLYIFWLYGTVLKNK